LKYTASPKAASLKVRNLIKVPTLFYCISGCVEIKNRFVQEKLVTWMQDHKDSEWSKGLKSVQWAVNTSHCRTIDRTPYSAVFGQPPETERRDYTGTLLFDVLLNFFYQTKRLNQ
jgi:hypothetical protein